MILNGSLQLTKLQSSLMKTKKGTECLVIPIDQNFLFKSDETGNVYINITVFINDEKDDYGNIASIKQGGQIKGKKWPELTEEEKATLKSLPYLGNLKTQEKTEGESGLTSSEPVEEDDLPF